jgi:drug/metabolite transporter (DMT)-like permease
MSHMTTDDNRIDARDWSLLGLLSVLWGGSFFFNGLVLRELPPLTVVFLRVALASLFLLPLLWLYRIRFPAGVAGWKPFFAIGLLNNVLPFSLIVVGQTYIASGLASILNATTPLFTVVVMAAAGEEKLVVRRIAGVIAGLIGVIILHGEGHDLRRGRASASCCASRLPSAMGCRRWWRDGCCRIRRRWERRRSRCWPRLQ